MICFGLPSRNTSLDSLVVGFWNCGTHIGRLGNSETVFGCSSVVVRMWLLCLARIGIRPTLSMILQKKVSMGNLHIEADIATRCKVGK